MLASWLPLQVSIATVFLFAGPHNWFELRYFLMRLPARFGRSRNFFAVAFAGIFTLTVAYLAMPALYYANLWSGANWPDAIATWNTLLRGMKLFTLFDDMSFNYNGTPDLNNDPASPDPFMYSQMPRSRWDREAANITHVTRSRSASVALRIRMLIVAGR